VAAPDPESAMAAFKQATIAVTRALAQKPKLKVTFGDAVRSDNEVALPLLLEKPLGEPLAQFRGVADQAALTRHLHNPAIHAKQKPKIAANARLFDTLENIRIETLGSRDFEGVRHNLARRFELHYTHLGYNGDNLPLQAMIELYARRHIQQMELPAGLTAMLEKKDQEFAPLIPQLKQMREAVASQQDFSQAALKVIDTFAFISQSLEKDERNDEQPQTEESRNRQESKQTEDSSSPAGAGGEELQYLSKAAMLAATVAGNPSEKIDDSDAALPPPQFPFNHADNVATAPNYRHFTSQFDEVVGAQSLATGSELEHLRGQLDQKLAQFQSLTARLAGKLQRLLMAKQARRWVFDEEEGMIDSRKLSRVIIHPDYQSIYKRESDTEFRDTVVTLLIDNSGSMRGRPITMAAMCADIISRTLERCGVKVEILGFTTKEWKGGQSYKQWIKEGRPALPGRLNDLRHIIYKSADASWRASRKNLGLMLKDGLLKENIDGEAILWACDRLLARPQQRRILMVISDGAPVDDATLSANSGSYLDRHLRDVIAKVENHLPIELVAIGIGHDVTRYYKRAVTISDIDKLAQTMTEQLARLFMENKNKK
jgi:cobaltochelatase CobT